jgi:ABC-type multidrug transport system fused ATPase/permease subunit
MDTIIIPDIISFIRKEVIISYLKTNEEHFNDKDIEKDSYKLIDFGFFFEKVFIWIIDSIIPTLILVIIMNIYFLVKVPIIGAITLVFNAINYIVIKSFFHKMMKVIADRQKHQDILSVIIGENLNNLMDIHLNNKINDTIDYSQQILEKYKEKVKAQLNMIISFIQTLKVINYSSNLLSIFVLYKTSINVESFFDIFSMFMLYIPIFENMTHQIPIKLGNLNDLILLADYFTKNKKIMDKDLSQVSSSSNRNLSIDKVQNIVFDNITFAYESNNIIKDFSLSINRNDRIAIMAQSGYGKSTLMKLLLGFYKPQKGRITINGLDISNIKLNNLRQKINYVNQKTLLLNDTIINNMKYGNNKTDKEIINILNEYDLKKIFKNSLNDQVELSGKNMSLGMQKIIFLMRGILKDSDVYIFDEPLTSLDKNTRDRVIKLINDRTKNKTLIIITHDDEILHIVNSIVSL